MVLETLIPKEEEDINILGRYLLYELTHRTQPLHLPMVLDGSGAQIIFEPRLREWQWGAQKNRDTGNQVGRP